LEGAAVPNPSESAARLRQSAGAHTSWANTEDPAARTAPARKAFLDRFDREYAHLPEADRVRRAAHARKAYFTTLAAKSAEVRRARKQAS
jgi:hypothetical protein